MSLFYLCLFTVLSGWSFASAQVPKSQLEPLTKFRQHRRTVDGRLCAAAFVQSRQVYTGCANDAPNPEGVSGQPWCYVEPQLSAAGSAWGPCAPATDYAVLREEAKRALAAKVSETQKTVTKLHKAELAAEKALDMYRAKCF